MKKDIPVRDEEIDSLIEEDNPIIYGKGHGVLGLFGKLFSLFKNYPPQLIMIVFMSCFTISTILSVIWFPLLRIFVEVEKMPGVYYIYGIFLVGLFISFIMYFIGLYLTYTTYSKVYLIHNGGVLTLENRDGIYEIESEFEFSGLKNIEYSENNVKY